MRDIRVAVIAAHAAHTKATGHAPSAQGAQSPAVPGDEDSLFAELLSKAGDADETSAKGDAKPGDAEALFAAHKSGEKSKKSKDVTDAVLPSTADVQMPSSQFAVLTANLSQDDKKTPTAKSDAANDNTDAVTPADADKDAGDTKAILNRMLDAKAEKPSGKNAPAKHAKENSLPDAAAAAANAVTAPNVPDNSAPQTTDAKAKASDAAQGVTADAQKQSQAPANNAAVAQIADQAVTDVATAADTKTATDAKTDTKADAKHAAKDANAQNTTPDKADALAAAADKNVRQTAATQGSQARILPVQTAAAAPAGQSDSGNGTDANTQGSPHAPAHAKNDTDTKTQPDAIQPASQAPVNTGNAAQPAPQAQAQAQTGNVHPMTAPVQTQATAPVVAASLQVGPQTAQAAAQPDIASLAVQIGAKSDDGVKQFDIRIDPPELGRVEVKLSIDDAGHAQAHLSVEKPQTLDMLQNDRSNLERALKDAGVNLAQNGLNFSLKGQERQNGNQQSPKSRNLAVTAAIEATSAAVAASTNSYATGDARLDIRV